MIQIIWEFIVKEGAQGHFKLVYGPGGTWSNLFSDKPGYRGTTLAVHSTLGFCSAFIGPLAVGVVLDLFGGSRLAWGMGFLCMATGCLLGPVFLARLKPGEK